MRAILASVAVLVVAGFLTAADEKIDAKKLVGKWEPAKAEPKAPPMILDIMEKGKFVLSVTVGDKTEKIDGTYEVDGNKLKVKMSFGGKTEEETLTILKLTDTELTTKDSKGKEDTLKKVKAK